MTLDAEAFLSPISQQVPCGPDLDQAFDPDFTGFMARAEGLLPQSFFGFKRDSAELAQQMEAAAALCARTRDLRLLAVYAKFAILDRDLARFSAALDLAARALEQWWGQIHPQAEGGAFHLRAAILSSLDDLPDVVMPLQHVALVEGRGTASISFRAMEIAEGRIAARADEQVVDGATIERAFEKADEAALRARREQFATVLHAAKRMEAAFAEGADHGMKGAISLSKLKALVTQILALLDARLPGAAEAPVTGGDAAGPPAGLPGSSGPEAEVGVLKSRAEAAAALLAAERYFARNEPSSPALVLLRFARHLMGKPFYAMLRLLVPDQASEAEIKFGGNAFRLPVERLAGELEGEGEGLAEDLAPEGEGPVADSRREAQRLLDEAAKFLRVAEPSNPAPLLLSRASELVGRDFSVLLKDMFTEAALRTMKGEER